MTCIVGLMDQGKVYIGGDSAAIAGYHLTVRADEKVFINGEFIMGFTTSFRMGQLLRYKFKPPFHFPNVTDDEYMATTFIDEVRKCLKEGGYARIDSGEEYGGTFLVGYRGQLYIIDNDYQVGKPIHPFDAVGCGAELAKGALHSYWQQSILDPTYTPQEILQMALEISEHHNAGVRKPFHILSIGGEQA